MFYGNYYPPFYPPIPQYQEYASQIEFNQSNPMDLDRLNQLLETQLAVSYEILSMARLNNQMLRTMISPSEELFFQHPAVYSNQT